MKFRKSIRNLPHTVNGSFFALNLRTKFLVFFIVLLVISVASSALLYQRLYAKVIFDRMNQAAMQVLETINSNIEANLELLASYSKLIMADDSIQDLLTKNTFYYNVIDANKVTKRCYLFAEANPAADSVYIVDNQARIYGYDKSREKDLINTKISETQWYQTALEANGAGVVWLDTGQIFALTRDEKYISSIRLIKEVESGKPIGLIIINVSEDYLKNSFEEVVGKYGTDIAIFDKKNKNIVKFHDSFNQELWNVIDTKSLGENYISADSDMKFMASQFTNKKYGWRIVSLMPYDENKKESSVVGRVVLTVLSVNSLLLFLGSLLLSIFITNPIKKLTRSMMLVEKGEFEEVRIKTGRDEIGRLKEVYNLMVLEIKKLISRVLEEQKIKRKAELEVLQAQIKPHFLYNTLETARSFALTGKNQQVNEVLKALGNYYRYSLSKGSEVISLKEEIEIVKNYMIIQKSRYSDVFDVEYDIEDFPDNFNILKLVLQPLVENALYHGIKPLGDKGVIRIAAHHDGNFMKLLVEDNGVGMSREMLEIINCMGPDNGRKSFGLKSTLERLRIFYGMDNLVRIESEAGIGTKIYISIPIARGQGG